MGSDPKSYEVELERGEARLRVTLRGDIDIAARAELDRIFQGLDPSRLERVLIDLREVTFFDTTGLNLAYRFDRWGKQHRIPVLFTRAAPNVMRGLAAAGLAHSLSFSDAPEDQLGPTD